MPWRDVRGGRQLRGRFVDGPLAGIDRKIASAPSGSPPQLLTAEAESVSDKRDELLYELVSWGHTVARYRVRT